MSELLAHLGGIDKFISPGDKVLLKPNMLEGVDKGTCSTYPSVGSYYLKVSCRERDW